MRYVIIAGIILAVYSFSRCYGYFTANEAVGLLQRVYCRASFLHFLPRKFSPLDFVVHLFLWLVVGIVVWRAYGKYLKGKFS